MERETDPLWRNESETTNSEVTNGEVTNGAKMSWDEINNDEANRDEINSGASPWRHWLTIWRRPRVTMRNIINEPNNYSQILLLLLLGGYIYAMNQASLKSMGDDYDMGTLFSLFALAAVLVAAVEYYVVAGIYYLLGKWIGGKGTLREVRLSVVYANIALIMAAITWIPLLLLFGKENFTSLTPMMDANPNLLYTLVIISVIELVLGIWGMVIALKCMAEAHQFSAWKALGVILLGFLAILVAIIVVAVIVVVLI